MDTQLSKLGYLSAIDIFKTERECAASTVLYQRHAGIAARASLTKIIS
jgi:hypothetical protein